MRISGTICHVFIFCSITASGEEKKASYRQKRHFLERSMPYLSDYINELSGLVLFGEWSWRSRSWEPSVSIRGVSCMRMSMHTILFCGWHVSCCFTGAKVHIIIQDKKDGIRDGHVWQTVSVKPVWGDPIPLNQVARLKQRCDWVNKLYRKDKSSYKRAVFIHVDSRSSKRDSRRMCFL